MASNQAAANPFDQLYVFGDSYSDMGNGASLAYPLNFPGSPDHNYSNGPTAVSYLATALGLSSTFSDDPVADSYSSINFAVSGAQIGTGNTMASASYPLLYDTGLLGQVADFSNRVTTGAISFNPATTLFYVEGGLNDGVTSTADVISALTSEVQTLVTLGAEHIEIALPPQLVPRYADVGARLDLAYKALLPQLQTQYGAGVTLSNFGGNFDDIIADPSTYGFTNVTTPSANPYSSTISGSPGTSFYYYPDHPSTAANQIVGEELYAEALTLVADPVPVPEPISNFGNTITAGANSMLNVVGDGKLVIAGAGATVSIVGSNDTVASTDAITVILKGDDGTVSAGAASQVTLQGGLDVAVNASASTLLVQTGVNSILSGSGNAAAIEYDSLLSVIGDGNAVAASGGDTVYVAGAGNTISSADDIGVNLLAGNGNTVGAGAGSYINIQQGINVAVNASASTLVMQDGVGVALVGSGNTVSTGHASQLDLAGDGNSVVANDGTLVNAAGSDNIVTSTGAIGVGIIGSWDVVTVGALSFIGLIYGNNITVNASGSTIGMQAGVGASVYGSGNTVTTGSGSSTAIYGSGNTVHAGNSASQTSGVSPIDLVSVGGTANLVFLGAGQAQVNDGSSNLTLVLSGPSLAAAKGIDIINGFGAARGAVVDLTGGISGYATAAAAFQAIMSDGQGGSLLALNATASLDFAGLPQSSLSAANFRVG